MTNLVQERQRSVLVGQVTDGLDRSHTSTHRVHALKSDDFRGLLGVFGELGLEIDQIVVLPDLLLGSRVPDALDHGGVVGRIRKVDTAGELGAEGG